MLIVFAVSLVLAIVIFFAFAYSKLRRSSNSQNLPPGTFGWPVIGETLQFMSALQKGAAEKFVLQRTTKYSSHVFKTSILGQPFVVFSGTAANKFVFRNEDLIRWRPPSVQKLFPSTAYVPIQNDAKKARKFISSFFRFNKTSKLVASMDSISRQHLKDHWDGKHQVRVYPLAKMYTFAVACHLFLSINRGDKLPKLFQHFHLLNKGLLSVHLDIPGTPFHRAVKAAEALRKELFLLIRERKEDLASHSVSPTQDVLSQMIAEPAGEDGFMSEVEIADKILAFLIGGYETTSAAITYTMKYLAQMPHLRTQVLQEQAEIRRLMKPRKVLCWDDIQKMSLTWNFVNEVMRHIPIIQGAFREAKTDINYEDFVIPKGWKVFWSVGSTQNDPEFFPDPQRFNPSRFEEMNISPYTFVPFGAGPLMCPGKEYAKVTILVFLHYVVTMFKWEPILAAEKSKFDNVLVPAEGFPVRLSPL